MTSSNWEQETKVGFITSCKQAARLVSLSFERRLTVREWVSMRIHLWTCKTCSFYRAQITSLRRVFIRHEEVIANTPPSGCDCLDSRAKESIKKNLCRQSSSSS